MTSRVTTLKTHVLLAGGSSRVTAAKLGVFASDVTTGLRVTGSRIGVHANDKTNGPRVTKTQLRAWVSFDQGLYFGAPFGGGEIFAPDFFVSTEYDSPAPPEVEVNPWQANQPNVDTQRILREQHNLLQAGDSTFHWGVLTEIYAEAEYNLGSLGRFYHDVYGIIHARFCKFSDFVPTDSKATPVGWNAARPELWGVTNQLEKSSPIHTVGVVLAYNESIYDGVSYGWVIVDGLVPAGMQVEFDSTEFMFGTEYSWTATGKVKPSAAGYSLGQRFSVSRDPALRGGEFRVELDKLSLTRLVGLISVAIAPETTRLDDLLVRTQNLETKISTLAAEVRAVSEAQASFATRFDSEMRATANALAAIRSLIPEVDYRTYVTTNIKALRTEFLSQVSILNRGIAGARQLAEEANRRIDGSSNAALQAQIDNLNGAFGGLTDRLVGFSVRIDTTGDVGTPLGAGAVLVSVDAGTTPGGTPLFEFAPLDFVLDSLLDVDAGSPTNGQVLTWDSPSSKWIAKTPAGGGGGGGGAPIVANRVLLPYTGAEDTYTVPDGVVRLRIHAWGGGGQGGQYSGGRTGGGGGYSVGEIEVVSGDSFDYLIGQGGQWTGISTNSPGGWPDGGSGSYGDTTGGGGGGSTQVYNSANDLLMVAGGGAGSAGYGGDGGAGGGLSGANGSGGSVGATQSAGGTSGGGGDAGTGPLTYATRTNQRGGHGGNQGTGTVVDGGGGGGGYYGGAGGGGDGRAGSGGSGFVNTLVLEAASTSVGGNPNPSGTSVLGYTAGTGVGSVSNSGLPGGDGMIVIEEMILGSLLADLTDVDVTTTPPTEGQVLTWDDTAEKWTARDSSGGGGGGAAWYFDPPLAADFSLASSDATNLILADDADIGLTLDAGNPADPVMRYAYHTLANKALAWDMRMRINYLVQSTNFSEIGLLGVVVANGRNHRMRLGNDGGYSASYFSNLTTYSSAQGVLTGVVGATLGWLRLASNGVNMQFYGSPNGKQWVLLADTPIATHLGAAPDRVGFYVQYNRAGNYKVVGNIDMFSLTGPGV